MKKKEEAHARTAGHHSTHFSRISLFWIQQAYSCRHRIENKERAILETLLGFALILLMNWHL